MIEWEDEQLEEVGLDKKKLASVVRRFKKLAAEIDSMGLYVYGASGSGNLIHTSRPTHTDEHGEPPDHGSVVAWIGQGFDGGDW